MARKRYSNENALKVLRETDVHLYNGPGVVSSCRKAEISDKTYHFWRKKFGGMGRSQLSEMNLDIIVGKKSSQHMVNLRMS